MNAARTIGAIIAPFKPKTKVRLLRLKMLQEDKFLFVVK